MKQEYNIFYNFLFQSFQNCKIRMQFFDKKNFEMIAKFSCNKVESVSQISSFFIGHLKDVP